MQFWCLWFYWGFWSSYASDYFSFVMGYTFSLKREELVNLKQKMAVQCREKINILAQEQCNLQLAHTHWHLRERERVALHSYLSPLLLHCSFLLDQIWIKIASSFLLIFPLHYLGVLTAGVGMPAQSFIVLLLMYWDTMTFSLSPQEPYVFWVGYPTSLFLSHAKSRPSHVNMVVWLMFPKSITPICSIVPHRLTTLGYRLALK